MLSKLMSWMRCVRIAMVRAVLTLCFLCQDMKIPRCQQLQQSNVLPKGCGFKCQMKALWQLYGRETMKVESPFGGKIATVSC